MDSPYLLYCKKFLINHAFSNTNRALELEKTDSQFAYKNQNKIKKEFSQAENPRSLNKSFNVQLENLIKFRNEKTKSIPDFKSNPNIENQSIPTSTLYLIVLNQLNDLSSNLPKYDLLSNYLHNNNKTYSSLRSLSENYIYNLQTKYLSPIEETLTRLIQSGKKMDNQIKKLEYSQYERVGKTYYLEIEKGFKSLEHNLHDFAEGIAKYMYLKESSIFLTGYLIMNSYSLKSLEENSARICSKFKDIVKSINGGFITEKAISLNTNFMLNYLNTVNKGDKSELMGVLYDLSSKNFKIEGIEKVRKSYGININSKLSEWKSLLRTYGWIDERKLEDSVKSLNLVNFWDFRV